MPRRLPALAASLSLLGACCYEATPSGASTSGGTTGSAKATGGSTGAAGTTGGSSGGTTGGGTTTGGSTGGATGAGPTLGLLYFAKVTAPQPGGSPQVAYSASAYFGPAVPPSSFNCSGGQLAGDCCYLSGISGIDGGVPTSGSLSAGDIAVSDGPTALGTLTYGAGSGTYTPLFSCGFGAQQGCDQSLSWSGGDQLAVAAPGSTVEAFQATVAAAPDFQNVSPSFSNPPVTIPLGADFTVSWTAPSTSAGAQVSLLLTAEVCALPPNNTADGVILCQVPDATGSVTVPQTLLAHFHSGDFGSVSVARNLQRQLQTPNAIVTDESSATLATIASYGSTSCVP
ncbi:MAG: hypothetical protein ACYCWW_03340 [Deltaproteobacteria bacterium]